MPEDPRLQDARLLRRVAQLIESDGLSQRGFGRPGRPKCLLGAFAEALGAPGLAMGVGNVFAGGRTIRLVGRICRRSGLADLVPRPNRPRSHRSLAIWMARWSDSVGHLDAVVRTLKLCAAKLESEADATTLVLDLALAWPSLQRTELRLRV